MAAQDARNPEIIFNLWYVYDDMGLIYSLRARAYVGEGSDPEKLGLLRRFAETDYLIARPFEVPQSFSSRIVDGGSSVDARVVPTAVLRDSDHPIALFEEALQALEAEIPAQTKLAMPRTPLVCITPLFGAEDGSIEPRVAGSMSFAGR
jgi:hypothetical protein